MAKDTLRQVLSLITKSTVLHVLSILSGIENQGTGIISLRSGEDKSLEAREVVTVAWQSCDKTS